MNFKPSNLIVFSILFILFSFYGYAGKEYNENIILNAVAQIDFLEHRNEKNISSGNEDKNWYIYFLGGTISDLQYIINESEENSFSNNFLNALNDNLIKLNKYGTAVYVAFTNYENKLLVPVIPKDLRSFQSIENYINGLILKNDFDLSSEELKLSKESFQTYQIAFLDKQKQILQEVYRRSALSTSSHANIIMPFTNYSLRNVLSQGGGYKEQKGVMYSLYVPKTKETFIKGEFAKRYQDTQFYNLQYSTFTIEKRIERMLVAIELYFDYKKTEYKECSELLTNPEYSEFMNKLSDYPSWEKMIEEDPCILKSLVKYTAPTYDGDEFERDMAIFVCAPLYAALAIPAGSIIGEAAFVEVVKVLIERYGAKKVKDVAQTMAINLVIQTTTNYYFGPENVTNESNTLKRWELALKEIDRTDLTQDALIEAFELNTRSDIILGCLTDGLEIDINNLENTKFDVKNCLSSAATQIVSKLLIDTSIGAGKQILNTLKNNPEKFVRGFREILSDSGKNGRDAFSASWKEVEEAFELKGSLIGIKLNVEANLGSEVEEYVINNVNNISANKNFSNTIKDVASEIELAIQDGSTNMTKLGANVSLNIEGFNGIRPTLMTELSDGSYKMIFVINQNLAISTIDDFLPFASPNRTDVLNAIKIGITPKFTLVGDSAQKYFEKSNTEIDITEIEIYTIDRNGTPKKNKLYSPNSVSRSFGAGDDKVGMSLKNLNTQELLLVIRSKLTKIAEKSIITKTLNSATANQQFTGQMIRRFGMYIDLNKVNPPHADIPNIGINDFKILEKKYFIRVSNSNNDTFGEWLISLEDFNNFKSIDEIKDVLALPNNPTHFSLAEIPQGIIIRESQAAKVWREGNYWGNGGTKQYLIQDFIEMEENIVKQWFSNPESLNNFFK